MPLFFFALRALFTFACLNGVVGEEPKRRQRINFSHWREKLVNVVLSKCWTLPSHFATLRPFVSSDNLSEWVPWQNIVSQSHDFRTAFSAGSRAAWGTGKFWMRTNQSSSSIKRLHQFVLLYSEVAKTPQVCTKLPKQREFLSTRTEDCNGGKERTFSVVEGILSSRRDEGHSIVMRKEMKGAKFWSCVCQTSHSVVSPQKECTQQGSPLPDHAGPESPIRFSECCHKCTNSDFLRAKHHLPWDIHTFGTEKILCMESCKSWIEDSHVICRTVWTVTSILWGTLLFSVKIFERNAGIRALFVPAAFRQTAGIVQSRIWPRALTCFQGTQRN